MSKFVDEVVFVCQEAMESTLTIIKNEGQISEKAMELAIRNAFEAAAKKFKVSESTIRDKCTRGLDLDTDEFVQLLKGFIISNDNTFVEKAVGSCKTERGDDSPANIRAKFSDLREKAFYSLDSEEI